MTITVTAGRGPGLVSRRVAVSAVFFVSGAGIGLWAAHIPLLQARLGLGAGQLGLVLLAVSLGAVLLMPISGALAARMGGGRASLLCAILFCLALPLPILAPTMPALIAAAVLMGASFGALDVSMNTEATAVEKAWGGPIMSSVHGFYSVGGLVGAPVGGLLIAADLGAGQGMALCCLAFALGLFLVRGGLAAREPPAERGPLLALPRGPALVLGALAFIAFLAEGAVLDWSAVFLNTIGGASVAAAASGYAGFSLTMTAGRFLGDPIVARLGRAWVMGGGGLLIAVGAAIAIGLPGLVTGTIGFAILGIGAANVVPVLFTLGGGLPGLAPAYGVAAVATLGYAGLLSGPPLIGFAAELAGLRAALGLLVFGGVVLGIGGVLAVRRVRDA